MAESLIIKAKRLLRAEMLELRISPAELARRLGVSPQRVTAMLRLDAGTKIDTLQGAFLAIDRCLELRVCIAKPSPQVGRDNDSIETARSA